ncbi:hypothetical protein M427DRAFT_63910 [Gonapodya prolifera JEL478]|uniref:Nudix hydrolase domain-containing protein n=1 Tax=Gonapodya prolifera (strain JEL478) TaxID=1344416 RepID=A0A138ZZH3_GONPJ|nr:hypothetical protein M427DRAFT_63910 [Gonapodya prolifera JEL478]|eukprot:KXS09533.1 hypothetical protein M427DRAFT_63910 [Gonapodya prolifera JEL478]
MSLSNPRTRRYYVTILVVVAILVLAAWTFRGATTRYPLQPGRSYFNPKGTPAVTVDVFAARRNRSGRIEILLVQRRYRPYINTWVVPGGFVEYGEDPIVSVARELEEETGAIASSKRRPQVFVVDGDPTRDPRGHGVTIGYAVLVDSASMDNVAGSDDAKTAKWVDLLDVVTKGVVGSPLDENPAELKLTDLRVAQDDMTMGFDHLSMIREFQTWLEASEKNLAWVVGGYKDMLLLEEEQP